MVAVPVRSSRQRLRFSLMRAALRSWARTRPASAHPPCVLDLGVEFGDAGVLARRVLGRAAVIHGVDLWPRAIERALATGAYTTLHLRNARDEVLDGSHLCDVAIAAEIVEHFDREAGDELVRQLRWKVAPGGLAIVTAPLGWMPQGPIGGNPHEVHRSAWSPLDLEPLGYQTLGVFPQHHLFVSAWTSAEVAWRA